jgi:hypothetical protein
VEGHNTTREEDKAYSLLGIFDVSIAPIYGEGEVRAFERLHDELLKRGKKRAYNEVSAVLQPNFDSRKRSTTQRSESPGIPSSRNLSHLNPQPRLYSMHGIDAGTKQSLIDQLHFTKIDERVTSLTAAQGTTCYWFFTNSVYKSWCDVAQQPEHSSFL